MEGGLCKQIGRANGANVCMGEGDVLRISCVSVFVIGGLR